MFCIWQGDVVLMAFGAPVTALLVQHLCHRRGFGTGLRFAGWALGAGLIVGAALIFVESIDEEWVRNCGPSESPSEFMGGTFVRLTVVGRLVVWSAVYTTALAAFWLVYRLVAPRQRVTP
jgi:hypothetical protein